MATRAAILFDLDGTLTKPNLDFDRIRAEIGLPPGPILEAIERMDADRRVRANAILNEYERIGAETAELYPNAREVIGQLRAGGFPVAIMTRNARRWSRLVLERFDIVVDYLRTRDDGVVKPSAEPVLAICGALGADPAASWVVGDFLFDIQSGKAAGTRTVLMIGDDPVPEFASLADHVIRDLQEVLSLVKTYTSCPPPAADISSR